MGDEITSKEERTGSSGQFHRLCDVCGAPGDRFAYCPASHATCKTCFSSSITEEVKEDEFQLKCRVTACDKSILLDSLRVTYPLSPLTVVLFNCEDVPQHASQATILFGIENVRKMDSKQARCPTCNGHAEYREKTQLYECPDKLCKLVTFYWWKSSTPTDAGPIHSLDVRQTQDETEAPQQRVSFPVKHLRGQEQKIVPGRSPPGLVEVHPTSGGSAARVSVPLHDPTSGGSAAGVSVPQHRTTSGGSAPEVSVPQHRTTSGGSAPGVSVTQHRTTSGGSAPGVSVPQHRTTSGGSAPGVSVPLHLPGQTGSTAVALLPLLSSGDPRNPQGAPACWAGMSATAPYLAIEVGVDSTEVRGVKQLLRFWPRTVNRVVRIQNMTLWGRYCVLKMAQEMGVPSAPSNERLVYQTVRKEKLAQVLEFGWSERFREIGLQFWLKPEVLGHTETPIVVSLCLAGLWTNGNPAMTAPPPRREGGQFHSIVDNQSNPTWIKLFDRSRLYPAYIVY